MDLKSCIDNFKNDIDLKYLKVNSILDDDIIFEKLPFDENCYDKIEKAKHVIYYIEIISNWENTDAVKFFKDFKNLKLSKEAKKLKINFPQINSECSSILYVGKSSTDFKSRIKYHCTVNSPSTYAIHYEYWKNKIGFENIKFEIHYFQFDEAKFEQYDYELQKELLEIIESSLHLKLKPLLGRSGH